MVRRRTVSARRPARAPARRPGHRRFLFHIVMLAIAIGAAVHVASATRPLTSAEGAGLDAAGGLSRPGIRNLPAQASNDPRASAIAGAIPDSASSASSLLSPNIPAALEVAGQVERLAIEAGSEATARI